MFGPRGGRQSGVVRKDSLEEDGRGIARLEPVAELGLAGLDAVAKVIKMMRSGEPEISLTQKGINDEACSPLGAALKNTKTLAILHLYHNNISDAGTVALATGLKNNKSLEELNLGWNMIGDIGAKAMAGALKTNKTLRWIDFTDNYIADEGAKAFAEVLASNTTLTWLDLQGNEIGDAGAQALAAALETNTTLSWLNLKGNRIDTDLLSQINASLQRNGGGSSAGDTALEADWFEAVNAVVANGDEHAWGRAKLVVVGQAAAGKTSTVRSLLGLEPLEDYQPTKIANVSRMRAAKNWRRIKDDVGEFDRQVRKAAMRRLRPAKESRVKSLPRIVLDAFRRRSSRGPTDPTTSRLATSGRMPNAHVQTVPLLDADETALRFAWGDAEHRVLHSADVDRAGTTGFDLSFTIWDHAGQDVYCALRDVFFTEKGVYLVVFDMRELVAPETRASAVASLRAWLDSIKVRAPEAPVLLVGTHLDQVSDIEPVELVLHDEVEVPARYPQVVRAGDTRAGFVHAVDNSSSDPARARELRSKVGALAVTQDHVLHQIPLAWLKIHGELLRTGRPVMNEEEVVDLAAEHGRGQGDVDAMLAYFHGLGVLVHFRNAESHAAAVVVDPEWLIDKLACVIGDPDHAQKVLDERDDETMFAPFERMRREAIATRSLLECLWQDQEVDFLIGFLEANLLMSPYIFDQSASAEPEYFVAGLLSAASLRSPSKIRLSTLLTCDFDFNESGSLPQGLYLRLIAQCVAHAARVDAMDAGHLSKAPKIGADRAKLYWGESAFLLQAHEASIRISVGEAAPGRAAAQVIQTVASMLRAQEEIFAAALPSWRLLLHSPVSGVRVDYADLQAQRAQGKDTVLAADDGGADAAPVRDFDAFVDAAVGALDAA